jgi:hypothetical protein
MRIICFDTESGHHFHSQRWQYGSDASFIAARLEAAEVMNATDKKFYGAVIYDFERREYREFARSEVDRLVSILSRADLLVSHSGVFKDLVVLEDVCGIERIAIVLDSDLYGHGFQLVNGKLR